ncbi:basic secretory protein-like protein [Mycolicibacterium celeriflavum]|uniref:basic secretory protein-like protein n=1 Tax=Mycolicibacterium celeriflavum TaxID=1249101 RepID=UPI0009F43B99|nr:basic secretory protein-like protein [Mycolicibacterium celeriflavum]MCV7237769.1 peptidase [Mycolicibacterium celeriflavum]ORA50027.1 peptidase [Mycolicibacterium celeriflavum]
MRRSTTSAATDRRRAAHPRSRSRLAALLVAELICALLLIGRADVAPVPSVATPANPTALTTPTAESRVQTLNDDRTVRLIGLGGPRTEKLLTRIAVEMNGAADAVTAFWGPQWPPEVVIAVAGSDAQFAAVGGGDSHTAATATAERIMFAPGAADMSDAALRIVLRHELFHYAARARTAPDAPRWLTEGVADYVARPATPRPGPSAVRLPTDAELAGPERSLAYDRAWWFSRFVADRYGPGTLRELYQRACSPGHPDVATAVQDTLGVGQASLLAQWQQWATGQT